MDLKRALRLLILCEIAVIVIGMVAESVGTRFLPAPLRSWVTQQYEAEPTARDFILFGVALLWLGVAIVSWVGLWRLWRPARPMYLVIVGAGIVLEALTGPWVYIGPTAAIWTAHSVLNGLIVGVIYWSPIREAFAHSPAAPPGGFEVTIPAPPR